MIMCSKANNFYLTSKCFCICLISNEDRTANRNGRPVYEFTIIGILTLHKSIIWCLVNSKSLGYSHLRKCRPPKSCTWNLKKTHEKRWMEKKYSSTHPESCAFIFISRSISFEMCHFQFDHRHWWSVALTKKTTSKHTSNC